MRGTASASWSLNFAKATGGCNIYMMTDGASLCTSVQEYVEHKPFSEILCIVSFSRYIRCQKESGRSFERDKLKRQDIDAW